MPLSAPRILPLLCIISMLGTSACDKPDRTEGYRHIGTVVFRRSYAGHENWTESQLDSVSRMDPEYMLSDEQSDHIRHILNIMGIAAGQKLLISEHADILKDTIVIKNRGSETDTAYIEKDTINWRMALCVKNGRTISMLPIEHVSSSFVAYLLPSRTGESSFIAVIQQYYIMNGDNYDVAVYGKADPRHGAK